MINFTVEDAREGGGPLAVDLERAQDIATRVGVPDGDLNVCIRFETKKDDEHGNGQMVAKEEIITLIVYVVTKDVYSDKAIYAINNALVHEIRHIGQVASMLALTQATEIDAAIFGRLAHREEYCCVTNGVPAPQLSTLNVCSVCGPVEVENLVADAEVVEYIYNHKTVNCEGTVDLVMVDN